MRIIGPDDAPVRCAPRAPGLRVRVLAGCDSGDEAGLVEVEIASGQTLPTRAHPRGAALVYVTHGRGRLLDEEGPKEVVGGAVAQLDSGRAAITNVGVEPLRLLVVYSPPGPERQFVEWGQVPDEASCDPLARLDLTCLPRRQRHRTVIAALEALDVGSRLLVLNDHEPVGLERQLRRRYEGRRLGWEVLDRRPEQVAVAIWLEEDPRARIVFSVVQPAIDGDLSPDAA